MVEEGEGRLQAAVAHRGHHRPAAGLDGVEGGEAARAAGEHHPGKVVADEQQRLLDRPGGVEQAPGPHLVQRVALPDGHEPVEGPQCRGAREHLDARLLGARCQLARMRMAALGQQAPAGLGPLVAEDHVGAQLGGGDRGAQPGRAPTHHEQVGVPATVLRAPFALGL